MRQHLNQELKDEMMRRSQPCKGEASGKGEIGQGK